MMANNTPSGKRFVAKKSLIFPFTLIVIQATFLLGLIFFREHTLPDFLDKATIGIWLLTLVYYTWQWTGTYYELRDGRLFYRSGITKGSIPLDSIRKIETGTRSWANTNAALVAKGMMITYNKWDEIFLAPKDETGFLKALLQYNPDIQIKTPEEPARFVTE